MPDIVITPATGRLEFVDITAQATRRHSFTLDPNDGVIFDAPFSASSVTAPLNIINVTVNNSNVNYPFVLAASGETGPKALLMDGAGGTYNPSTNTATIDISGNSATTTLASNSSQLNGQAASYYTNIPARLGYTPANKAGDTITGDFTVNGNFTLLGNANFFSASNIYITSSVVQIDDNIITLNAFSPYLRYAGIEMYDSGSGTLSQFLWDGQGDYFFLSGSGVNGKILTGPDSQADLSANYIPKATGGYKLGNSLIQDNATTVTIGGTTVIDSSTPATVLRLKSAGSTVWSLGVTDAAGSYFNITADFGSLTINKTNGAVSSSAFIASGTITANSFTGAGTGLTGTAASLTVGSATSAGSVTNAVTFNNGGSGDASGTTFNGSAARTISYNTIGAPKTDGTNATGTWNITSSWATNAVTALNVGNGTITIAAGTGVGVGTTNTFTTNQSGNTTVTITNNGVTSNVAGTGISVSGATGAVTITNSGVTSLTGTTNQVSVSAGTGAVTLSLPQDLHTGAGPTFSFVIPTSGFIKSDNIIGLLTTGNAAQKLRTGGILIGQSYDAGPNNNEIRTTNNTSLIINARGTGEIQFQTNDSQKAVLLNDGSFAIGRSTALTTGGTAALSIGGTYVLSIGASNTDLMYSRRLSTGVYQFQTYNASGNAGEIHLEPYGGNVGIGTTSPTSKLTVVGTVATSSVLSVQGTNGTLFNVIDDLSDSLFSVNNSAGLPVIEAFADDRVIMGQYNANDFVIKNNKVGIGTNNPTAELHVTSSTSVPSAIFQGGNVGINTTDFSYTSNDNSRLVGSTTNNKVFISGSIQLLNNNDAIVFGRGTSTFLTDEELGFGWGGGWYMVDDTWVRVRNNKNIYGGSGVIRTDGEFQVGGSGAYFLANSTETKVASVPLRVVTDSITAANAGTRGLLFDGNYTDGKYRHRIRKYDDGNGLPLYIDYAHGTANSYTAIARFGGGGTYNSFTVYGNQDITGSLTVSSNITAANLSGTNTGDQNVGNGTITIAAGTGIGVGTTNTFTTNQSGATTVTVTNNGVTSNVAGTGISVSGATGAVTITNGGVTSLTGTTNQVNVSAGTGGVTLSLPQNIHTGASPTFATVTANLTGNVTGNVSGTAGGETLGTVTGRGGSTGTQIIVATAAGQAMYVGRQAGAGYSYGSAGIFTALSDNPNGGSNIFYQGYISSSSSTPGTGILTYSVRADGQIYTTMNSATGVANNSFNVGKAILGAIHIANGSGTSGNNNQAAITFQGGSSSEAQAGIYVSNNSSTGTAMGFATTDSYATGPQLFMTATNTGVVNFPRARPTYAGNALVDVAGGQTIAGITYFSNGESMNVYGIRGRFTNEYLHLYNKVGVGHPGGWGQGEGNTPTNGLSTYGGLTVAYGNNANAIFYGNVGVGTTSVYARVESYYSSNAITFNYLATNLNNNSPIPVYGFDVTNGVGETRSIKAGIGYERHLTNGRGTLHFYNASTNDTQSLSGNRTTAGDIKMSIDNSGNVGISTTTPATKLDVYGSISIRGTNVLSTWLDINGSGLAYDIYANIRVLRSTSAQADGMYIGYGGSGGPLRFFSNSGANVEYVTFATSGNVGIGSTTPAALLNVRASVPTGTGTVTTGTNILIDSNTNNYITFRNTADNGTYAGLVFLDNNVGGYIAFGNAGASVGSDSMLYGAYQDHIFQNNYVNETLYNRTETMRIKQNGNVGIGTSVPGQKLDVEGRIRTRGATGTGGFEIGAASTGTAKWRIEWDSASDSLDFNWVG